METPASGGLHHSPSLGVLYAGAVIHDSLASSCRRCDVRDVTKPFTPLGTYVTHRHDIVNPLLSRRVTSFMDYFIISSSADDKKKMILTGCEPGVVNKWRHDYRLCTVPQSLSKLQKSCKNVLFHIQSRPIGTGLPISFPCLASVSVRFLYIYYGHTTSQANYRPTA